MRLSIRVKQIVGVTAIVGLVVVALSALFTNRLANVVLQESLSRGKMLANTILHRAGGIVTGDVDPYVALREDQGLRSILEGALLDIMFDLPSLSNVRKVVMDEGSITGDQKPLLIYSDQPKVAGSA